MNSSFRKKILKIPCEYTYSNSRLRQHSGCHGLKLAFGLSKYDHKVRSKYNTSQWITIHYRGSQYITGDHNTSHSSTLHHNASQYITVDHNISQWIIVNHNTSHFITIHHILPNYTSYKLFAYYNIFLCFK